MAHLVPDAVAQDAGIVHHRIDPAKALDRVLDDRGGADRIGDAGGVGMRLTAGGTDVGDGLRGGAGIAAFAFGRDARIVDHHRRAFACAEQGDLATDSAPCAGDRDHASFEHCHAALPLLLLVGLKPYAKPICMQDGFVLS
jgi:hypothetical protein